MLKQLKVGGRLAAIVGEADDDVLAQLASADGDGVREGEPA